MELWALRHGGGVFVTLRLFGTFWDISMISELSYVVLLIGSVAVSSKVTFVPFEGEKIIGILFFDGRIEVMASGFGFGRIGGHSGRFDILANELSDDDAGRIDGQSKRRRRSTGGTFNNNTGDSFAESAGRSNLLQSVTTTEFKAMSADDKLVALFELMSSVGNVNARVVSVENRVTTIDKQVTTNANRLKLLEYKSIDAEARNRRNNLIFRGIDETMNEDDDEPERRVLEIIREHLKIDHTPVIQRAHRLGTLKRRRRTPFGQRSPTSRPIIVCFRDYKDVELILSYAYKLSNTNYGINKDFPKEITEARSKLWPLYKTERQRNPRGSVYIGFPAKLVVGKRVVEDLFPDWYTVIRGSRCSLEQHSTADAVHFPPPPPPPPPPPEPNSFSTTDTIREGEAEYENNQPHEMEISNSGGDAAPLGTPTTNDPGTEAPDEPEPNNTAYDKAMNRLLETIANRCSQPDNQTAKARKPRSSSVPRSNDRAVEIPPQMNAEASKRANDSKKV